MGSLSPSRFGSPRVSIVRLGFCSMIAMERVEFWRSLRAKMYAKLNKENSLQRVDLVVLDFGWVFELVK